MAINCTCKLLSAVDEFPARFDQSSCPTHGPDAPQFFVDHGQIHDRVTGKHVSLDDAVEILNVPPGASARVAWGVVATLAARLRELEPDR